MRCDKCKFWENPEDSEFGGWRNLFGRCKQTPFAEDIGEWDHDAEETEWVMTPEYADRTATVSDASAYSAELRTKPEHFCSMFQKGETT